MEDLKATITGTFIDCRPGSLIKEDGSKLVFYRVSIFNPAGYNPQDKIMEFTIKEPVVEKNKLLENREQLRNKKVVLYGTIENRRTDRTVEDKKVYFNHYVFVCTDDIKVSA